MDQHSLPPMFVWLQTKNSFCILKWLKKVKREMIFFNTWESYEIHIWVSLKFHWDTVMQLCLAYGCLCYNCLVELLQQSCNGLQSLECYSWPLRKPCLLLVWNKAETLQIPSGPTYPWNAKSLPPGLRAFSGPECPTLGSQQVGSSHRSLPWGSRFVSVSIDGYIPRLLVPCWAYSTLLESSLAGHSANCLSKTPFTDLHSTTLFAWDPLHQLLVLESLLQTVLLGENPKPRQMWIIRVYILFRVSLWYISYSGVMKNL